MRPGPLLVLSLPLWGCGLTVVDGITVREASYNERRAEILARAERDLPCPRGEITTRLLEVHPSGDVDRLAVKGCGREVVYAPGPEGFAMETSPPAPER
jgi:hypothetical protein